MPLSQLRYTLLLVGLFSIVGFFLQNPEPFEGWIRTMAGWTTVNPYDYG